MICPKEWERKRSCESSQGNQLLMKYYVTLRISKDERSGLWNITQPMNKLFFPFLRQSLMKLAHHFLKLANKARVGGHSDARRKTARRQNVKGVSAPEEEGRAQR